MLPCPSLHPWTLPYTPCIPIHPATHTLHTNTPCLSHLAYHYTLLHSPCTFDTVPYFLYTFNFFLHYAISTLHDLILPCSPCTPCTMPFPLCIYCASITLHLIHPVICGLISLDSRCLTLARIDVVAPAMLPCCYVFFSLMLIFVLSTCVCTFFFFDGHCCRAMRHFLAI